MKFNKPARWGVVPGLTEAPELWHNALVAPMWIGGMAYFNGVPLTPTEITSFAPRPTIMGMGYGQDTGDSGTPKIKYPSGAFDRAGITDLTFIAWVVPNNPVTDRGASSDALAGNTTANDDGIRPFLLVADDSPRWRIPQAAGNVNISSTTLWAARDLVQYVGRLGGGTQDLDIYNATTGASASSSSASSASITFNEGSFWIGQQDDGATSSLPGDIVFVYLQFRRWSDAEIIQNRQDPFAMLRMSEEAVYRVPVGAVTEADFTLTATPAMTLAGDAIGEAAFALAVTPAMVALADATSEAAVAMAATAGLTFNGLATSEGALALQTVAAMLLTGDAQVEGSLTLPVIPGVTFAADEDTDVALALAMTAGVSFTGQVTAEASVSLAAIAALGMTAGSAAEAGLDIATTFAMGVVADALAEAGLSLGAITSITIDGEQVIISIEVSPGRTITVAIEARVILVDAEARTLIVDAENRTITVKDDGQ